MVEGAACGQSASASARTSTRCGESRDLFIGFGLVMPSGAGVVPLGVFVCFVGLLVGRVADSFGGAVSSVRDGV